MQRTRDQFLCVRPPSRDAQQGHVTGNGQNSRNGTDGIYAIPQVIGQAKQPKDRGCVAMKPI